MQVEIRSIRPLSKDERKEIADALKTDSYLEALRDCYGYVNYNGKTLYLGSSTGIYSNIIDI